MASVPTFLSWTSSPGGGQRCWSPRGRLPPSSSPPSARRHRHRLILGRCPSAGSVTTSASMQRPPRRTLLTNTLLASRLLHGDMGAVADLRRERALDVLAAAAVELLVAGRPADEEAWMAPTIWLSYNMGLHSAVRLPMASGMAARHSSLLGRNE